MAVVKHGTALFLTGLCLYFASPINASPKKDCNCRGPTNYYKEVGCTPVFKNPDDCCPVRYDCSIFNNVTVGQCLVNGHVYQQGELLRAEDTNDCEWCYCSSNEFQCAVSLCETPRTPKFCHVIPTDECCNSQIVCPKEDGSYATCIVDGKTYKDGETFVPSAELQKRCRCAPGYAGENIEPYCKSPKHTWCSNVLHSQDKIRICAPVYGPESSLKTACNHNLRCPADGDEVIEQTNQDEKSEFKDPGMMCKFGNLSLKVGDELNETPDTIKCVCEVPPILTCRYRILPGHLIEPYYRAIMKERAILW